MALPTQFASLTDATGQELDNNFAALGALTPIPCTASGSNTITLVANANTPTIAAYSNYMQFTGIAALSNTGAATGKLGTLATLSIFKASPSGPVALTGGEIIAGVAFTLLYDSALNTGSGGFHLMQNSSVITTAGGTITGPLVGSGSLATITFPVGVFPLLSGVTLASITRMSIGGGQTVTRILSTTSSITWGTLNPQTSLESIVSLAGCSVGDAVQLGFPASVASQITYRGYIPNAGSLAIVAMNYSASTITPTPGTYRGVATGFTG